MNVKDGINYFMDNNQLPAKERFGLSAALVFGNFAADISYAADVLIESFDSSYKNLKSKLGI